MGTVMVGSLIITIVRIIRILIRILLGKHDQKCSTLCCLCCCSIKQHLKKLEDYLRYFNRNAYIVCALHGKGFLSSAKYAINILLRNGFSTVTLVMVTKLVIFMSKLLVTLAMGFSTYFLSHKFMKTNSDDFVTILTVIITLLSYYGSTIFFTVHVVAIDTIFICFVEDCERNDGSIEKPYYMSAALMKIIKPDKKDELKQELI